MNSNGDVIAEHTEFIGFADDEPQTVTLNFDVPAGEDYLIGTDATVNQNNLSGQNPQLKRTGTNGNLSYPYVLDGVASIEKAVYYGGGLDNSGGDDYTTYYYYLYDWEIGADTINCTPVPVPITVEDCNSIEEILLGMDVYPNPTEGVVSVSASLEKESNIRLTLTNSLVQTLYTDKIGKVNLFDKTYDWSMLPKGLYSVCLEVNNQKTFKKIVLQ